jgi:hypothetical protein
MNTDDGTNAAERYQMATSPEWVDARVAEKFVHARLRASAD